MASAYPDFSWFVRAVRILPIVAGAVIAGGVIGGFSVFAVDRALAPSQPVDSSAQANAATNRPVRVIGTPPPNAVAAANVQASAQPSTTTSQVTSATPAPMQSPSPLPQSTPAAQAASNTPPKAWPDAMSRAHPTAETETATAPSRSAPVAAMSDQPTSNQQPTERRASSEAAPAKSRRQLSSSTSENNDRVATRPPVDRQHTVTTVPAKTSQPDADDSDDDDATASNPRPVYDYYGGRHSSGDPRYSERTRVIVRHGPPPTRLEENAPPPRPEPFWGSRERDDGDDD